LYVYDDTAISIYESNLFLIIIIIIITFIIIIIIINIHSISNSSVSTVRTVRAQYFEEACSWAANEKTPLSAVVLVGHWNTPGDGCEGGLSVPSAYQKLLTLNACKPIASKVACLLLMMMMDDGDDEDDHEEHCDDELCIYMTLLLLMLTFLIVRNCCYIHMYHINSHNSSLICTQQRLSS
jgi:hypothetical protein